MEIQKENRFIAFCKKYGLYLAVGAVVFVMALTFTMVAVSSGTKQVSVTPLKFELPMTNAMILKDYCDDSLQNNETLNQWEAHMSIDMASEDGLVYAVLDGTIAKIDYNFLDGHSITINHQGGLVSVYSSLKDEITHKVGDVVKAGEKIGKASTSASGELDLGEHLCLTMKVGGNYVYQNKYLDLQQK